MLNAVIKLFLQGAKKSLYSLWLRANLRAKSVRADEGFSMSGAIEYHIGTHTTIRRNVRLHGKKINDAEQGRITIGKQTLIGESCEFGVQSGSQLVISDCATINDRCKLFGDIHVGAYTLLSANIYISSFDHTTNFNPYWLIKEQDKAVLSTSEIAQATSLPVVIEEDVWLGFGIFVKRGVYIGRGAIVGAGAVVTKDILPYETHIGIPNRKQGNRLKFSPPDKLFAEEEAHSPYFYRGFGVSQEERKKAAAENGLFASSNAFCVLKQCSSPTKLEITASLLKGHFKKSRNIEVSVGGSVAGQMELVEGMKRYDFLIDRHRNTNTDAECDPIYRMKDCFSIVEFRALDSECFVRDAFVIGSISQNKTYVR